MIKVAQLPPGLWHNGERYKWHNYLRNHWHNITGIGGTMASGLCSEDFQCLDSLKRFYETQLQTSFAEAYPNYCRIFAKENNSWQKLNVLLRLRELNKLFHDHAFGTDHTGMSRRGKFKCKITNEITVGEIPYSRDLTYNDLLSINGSEFKVDSSHYLQKASYSDTLRITYFHDNYSYGMGGDSILKEYVFDISQLKGK